MNPQTTIAETNELRLQNDYENVQLIDKRNNKVLAEEDFYGDPTCGLIETNNKWAIVAGKHLILWLVESKNIHSITFETDKFQWICQLKQVNESTIEILLDPWYEHSAIWQLDITNQSLKKLSDFPDYRHLPYTENIIW